MTEILLAVVVFAALMTAMAVGVLFGRKPIQGSCGGMKALGMDMECEICGGDPQLCDSEGDRSQSPTNSSGVSTFEPKPRR